SAQNPCGANLPCRNCAAGAAGAGRELLEERRSSPKFKNETRRAGSSAVAASPLTHDAGIESNAGRIKSCMPARTRLRRIGYLSLDAKGISVGVHDRQS